MIEANMNKSNSIRKLAYLNFTCISIGMKVYKALKELWNISSSMAVERPEKTFFQEPY